MGENGGIDKGLVSKIYKQLTRLNIKNKNKTQRNQKMGGRSKQTFLQRHTDGQKAYEKMFNITNYERNANQKHMKV